MKNLIKEIGLPTISKVGKVASYNAWLLVQHSPDLEFQKEYLKLLKENRNDINLANIAYLEDRVLMYEKKPQLYGTQFSTDKKTGKPKLYKIHNKKSVNKKRKEYSLGILEEYIKQIKDSEN